MCFLEKLIDKTKELEVDPPIVRRLGEHVIKLETWREESK